MKIAETVAVADANELLIKLFSAFLWYPSVNPKPALSRFSNALKINALSFHFNHLLVVLGTCWIFTDPNGWVSYAS